MFPGGAAKTPAGALGTECTVSPQADVPFNGDVSFYCKRCLFLLTWGQLSPGCTGQEHPQPGVLAAWPGEGMEAGKGETTPNKACDLVVQPWLGWDCVLRPANIWRPMAPVGAGS